LYLGETGRDCVEEELDTEQVDRKHGKGRWGGLHDYGTIHLPRTICLTLFLVLSLDKRLLLCNGLDIRELGLAYCTSGRGTGLGAGGERWGTFNRSVSEEGERSYCWGS
jgi:hypothetical protein